MTKEEIILDQIGSIYHAKTTTELSEFYLCMDAYAKQQAIDFALNYAKSFRDDTYVKPTPAELERMSVRYDKFIEQQNKDNNGK